MLRPLKNAQFRSSSRKAKILTTGIYGVFRGLKFELDADTTVKPRRSIGRKGVFFKSLILKNFVILLFASVSLILYAESARAQPEKKVTPKKIIFDTDLSSDVDDVGAVSVLHALADKGELNLLAMMVSSGDPWSTACLDALNTFFGRPDIPIGRVSGEGVIHSSKYTQKVSKEFPHDVGMSVNAEDAVSLYRKILSRSEDRSVLIITVGFLTNLKSLLKSPADGFSQLTGLALVKQKVEKLVCMGGKYPSGREWNFYQDAAAARYVVGKWPSTIDFVGYEVGVKILTGAGLARTVSHNPVKQSYQLYNGLKDRSSWDQLAVLYAIRGEQWNTSGNWERVRGWNTVKADGSNKWIVRDKGPHSYLILNKAPKEMAAIIEELMIFPISSRLR